MYYQNLNKQINLKQLNKEIDFFCNNPETFNPVGLDSRFEEIFFEITGKKIAVANGNGAIMGKFKTNCDI